MNLNIVSPSKALIEGATDDEIASLTKQLSYTNTASQHKLKRHYNNHWARSKNPDGWQKTLEELKDDVHHCLLFADASDNYIRPGSIPYLTALDIQCRSSVVYPTPKKIAWEKPLPFQLYDYQEESWQKLLEVKHGNVELCTGCHAKGTKILMFDGTTKEVENIKIGDKVMGPDSSPRNVLRLFNGVQEMYTVTPIKGDPFTINKSHVLSLERTNVGKGYIKKNGTASCQNNGKNPIINVTLEEYLTFSKKDKHLYKLYRRPIEFSNTATLKIPPYILGLWLGDGGSSRCSLTTMDEEIRAEWCKYVLSLGLDISVDIKKDSKAKTYNGIIPGKYIPNKKMQNDFNILLNNYGLVNNKHIPFDYLVSSREDRLQLLAAFMDTDGYLGNGYYEIIQKNNRLSKDILFLSRSLGFAATSVKKESKCQTGFVGEYNRINIAGNISDVPCRLPRKKALKRRQIKNVLRTGFKVESVGVGEYFGFELDGDHLYVLEDFTVTHNSGKSAIILKICRETGFRTAIIAPSQPIFFELVEKFEYHFGRANVGAFGDGKKKLGKRFTICIDDSIANIKPGTEEWDFFSKLDMFCADESHTWGAETLERICHGVLADVPYRMFFSGTQTRGDGAEKLLHSIIGKTVCSLTTEEAVKKGYICPHEYRIVEIDSSNPNYATSDAIDMKRNHFLRNTNICNFIAKLAGADARLHKRQTLVLVEELGQVAMLLKLLEADNIPTAIAHSEKNAKRLLELGIPKVDRKESIDRFNKAEVMVLIGTSCISTGTNIYPVHNCVNWQGGTSEIKTKQGAVGRAVRLGKANPWASRCVEKLKSIIWDFLIPEVYIMAAHTEDRIGYYSDSGSEIKYINMRKSPL